MDKVDIEQFCDDSDEIRSRVGSFVNDLILNDADFDRKAPALCRILIETGVRMARMHLTSRRAVEDFVKICCTEAMDFVEKYTKEKGFDG